MDSCLFTFFNASCWFCVCSSRPEDRGHQKEAAAVHRAMQVTPQLAEPLICLCHASLSRPDQPGQTSNTHKACCFCGFGSYFEV